MSSLKELIIPTVSAQDRGDASAQPTFGVLDLENSQTSLGSVLIKTNKTDLNIGETVRVTVEVNTNSVEIEEYRLSLSFDATKFTAIDTDANAEGTQVTLLDPIFKIEDPAINNLVTSTGRIRVIAKTDSRVAVNRAVIEFQLQAQVEGTTAISVVEAGESPTELVRESGVGLDFTPNSVNINIVSSQVNPVETSEPVVTPGQQIPVQQQNVNEIPKTAIQDYLPSIPFIAGIFLLILGSSLLKNKKEQSNKKIG